MTVAPKRLGQLDRGHADAAGAALDQQRLARLQAAAVEHVDPDGEEGLRQAGRLDVAQALGHRQALADRRDAQLGIAAAGDQRADAVADLEARRAPCASASPATIVAGDFEPGQVRGARRHRVEALALQHVGAVDARRGDADQHFARRPAAGLGPLASGAAPRAAPSAVISIAFMRRSPAALRRTRRRSPPRSLVAARSRGRCCGTAALRARAIEQRLHRQLDAALLVGLEHLDRTIWPSFR